MCTTKIVSFWCVFFSPSLDYTHACFINRAHIFRVFFLVFWSGWFVCVVCKCISYYYIVHSIIWFTFYFTTLKHVFISFAWCIFNSIHSLRRICVVFCVLTFATIQRDELLPLKCWFNFDFILNMHTLKLVCTFFELKKISNHNQKRVKSRAPKGE